MSLVHSSKQCVLGADVQTSTNAARATAQTTCLFPPVFAGQKKFEVPNGTLVKCNASLIDVSKHVRGYVAPRSCIEAVPATLRTAALLLHTVLQTYRHTLQ